jgi:hypothetical protein
VAATAAAVIARVLPVRSAVQFPRSGVPPHLGHWLDPAAIGAALEPHVPGTSFEGGDDSGEHGFHLYFLRWFDRCHQQCPDATRLSVT